MDKYMKKMSRYHRFIYGTNPVSGFRLPISVLKTLLYGRYGQRFEDGSKFYDLIYEIYEHATLDDSNSTSVLPDGGVESMNNINSGMGIVEINVDADGTFDGEIPPPNENDLRIEKISRE
ncbi:hypothetical protein [Salinadaptatus halalkaliphilus]|uniref:hypothetical protein n=1 Tax=Salinadaptatus halalkaliphilus TaxID=2419781 RepID=UPI001141EEDD|nr:hypothetical protein [Salinadaptatus halalkaliphilus]